MLRGWWLVWILGACGQGGDKAGPPAADETDLDGDTDPSSETDATDDADPSDDTDDLDTDAADTDVVDTDAADTDVVDTDVVDTDEATDLPVETDPPIDTGSIPRYGPPNAWYHASTADVPAIVAPATWQEGASAPNFVFRDQHGDDVELYQFYGQYLLIEALAMWCGPCQDAAPHQQALWESVRGSDTTIMSVMLENNSSQRPQVADLEAWVQAFGITHPVLGVDNVAADTRTFDVSSVPTVYLVNPEMTVLLKTSLASIGAWHLKFMVPAGTTPNPEDCGDGVDNDIDVGVDCEDPDCHTDARCAATVHPEAIELCSAANDVWRIETAVTAGVEIDTVNQNTSFNPIFGLIEQPGVYQNDNAQRIGDDEMVCSVPALGAGNACVRSALPPGTWEVVVDAGNCNNARSGRYEMTVRGATSVTLIQDDIPDFLD